MRTLFIVSGGDAPGINTVLFRYAEHTNKHNDSAVGAVGGFAGLLDEQVIPLSLEQLGYLEAQPGTYLASSREPVLSKPEAKQQLLDTLQKHEIDNMVLFGGNGTLHHVFPLLTEWGVQCIALPVTIDNDVPGTEYTLGFDSACNYGYQAVDGVRATARALPGRIFMLETLGGNTGFLALQIAFGGGASAVLIPEIAYDNQWLTQRLLSAIKSNGHALLVISEGIAASRTLATELPEWTGIRMRDIRLGHGQRGGTPTHRDRITAAYMANLAHDALKAGKHGVVVIRNGQAVLHEGTLQNFDNPVPDQYLYNTVNGLSE